MSTAPSRSLRASVARREPRRSPTAAGIVTRTVRPRSSAAWARAPDVPRGRSSRGRRRAPRRCARIPAARPGASTRAQLDGGSSGRRAAPGARRELRMGQRRCLGCIAMTEPALVRAIGLLAELRLQPPRECADLRSSPDVAVPWRDPATPLHLLTDRERARPATRRGSDREASGGRCGACSSDSTATARWIAWRRTSRCALRLRTSRPSPGAEQTTDEGTRAKPAATRYRGSMLRYRPGVALIVVDVQNDFADPEGSLSVAGGADVIPVINEQVRPRAEQRRARVRDPGLASRAHAALRQGRRHLAGSTASQDTWGAQLHPDLERPRTTRPSSARARTARTATPAFTMRDPTTGETIPTELGALLKAANVDEVVVTGLATDYCVRATALDSASLGFHTTLLTDAVRRRQPQAGRRRRGDRRDGVGRDPPHEHPGAVTAR